MNNITLGVFSLFWLGTQFCLAQTERVGINTDNPQTNLDVEGGMIVRKLGEYNSNSAYLTWDPDSKIFSQKEETPLESLGFKLMTYHIRTNTRKSVFFDFDTKIPRDRYHVFLMNYNVVNAWHPNTDDPLSETSKSDGNGSGYFYRTGVKHLENHNDWNPIPLLDVTYEPGHTRDYPSLYLPTWHIIGDFPGAKTYQSDNPLTSNDSYGPLLYTVQVLIAPRTTIKYPYQDFRGSGGKYGIYDIDIRETTIDPSVRGDANSEMRGPSPFEGVKNPLPDNPNDNTRVTIPYTPYPEKVGIVTDNPKATLDVNGYARVSEMEEVSSLVGYQYVRRNTQTGELIESSDASFKPFTALKYKITPYRNASDSKKRDLVYKFDTKIPVQKYHLVISNAILKKRSTGRADVGITHELTGGHNGNPFLLTKVYANEGSTYKISMDYINAAPQTQDELYWEVSVILFNKEMVDDIYDQNPENMRGNTGSYRYDQRNPPYLKAGSDGVVPSPGVPRGL